MNMFFSFFLAVHQLKLSWIDDRHPWCCQKCVVSQAAIVWFDAHWPELCPIGVETAGNCTVMQGRRAPPPPPPRPKPKQLANCSNEKWEVKMKSWPHWKLNLLDLDLRKQRTSTVFEFVYQFAWFGHFWCFRAVDPPRSTPHGFARLPFSKTSSPKLFIWYNWIVIIA